MAGHGAQSPTQAMTLEALNRLVGQLVSVPATQNVWVTAELSDVAVRGGHCYLELLQKDPATGRALAKARGVIWANMYPSIAATFRNATGQEFASGIKVMLRVSVTYHAVFGLSLLINAVNPDYTMGDLMRRRAEILHRLQQEGVLEANRSLQWPEVPRRLAVISAPGAAGYGDFIDQLFHNTSRLRYSVKLFQAVMQGDKAPASILAALDAINAEADLWDGVVIIRGGGATSDLAAFEHYDLAAAIAQFPIPVIVGIGHERDITVLDYVANMRVKTPTAAAEWLIGLGNRALERQDRIAAEIYRIVTDRLSGCQRQLAYYEGLLPTLPAHAVARAKDRLARMAMAVSRSAVERLAPARVSLESRVTAIETGALNAVRRQRDRLESLSSLIAALSPQATLARGYTITRVDGHAVTDAAMLAPGVRLTTVFAKGEAHSTVTTVTTVTETS